MLKKQIPTSSKPIDMDLSVSVTALNEAGKVRVTWRKPKLGAGQAVTGYSVQYKKRSISTYTSPSVSGSTTTSHTIANLSLGTLYDVRVAALGPRDLRLSEYCCNSVTTYNNTPRPTDASVSVEAIDEAGKIKVAWSKPKMKAGQEITGYSIQYKRKGTHSYMTRSMSGSNDTSYIITKLDLGTVYEVKVAAVGPLGLGAYCCVKMVTTYQCTPPPTDSSVSVEAMNEAGKVKVAWSRPKLGVGQVVTGYSVQYRIRHSASYSASSVSGSKTTSYTIANLHLGKVYEVRVAAVGPLGLSGYCCGSGKEVMTYDNAPPPTDASVSVAALNEAGKVLITWRTPRLGAGQEITGYSVQYREKGSVSYTTDSVSSSSNAAQTLTINNLSRGAGYEVRIASLGPLGLSGYCSGNGKEVTTFDNTPPPTDANVSVEAMEEAGTIKVAWSKPELGVGQEITGYSVRYKRKGTHTSITRSVPGSNNTSYIITNLDLGTVYEVKVASVGPLGSSGYCCGIEKMVTTYNSDT